VVGGLQPHMRGLAMAHANPFGVAERDVVRDVLSYLRLMGIPAWRQNVAKVQAPKRHYMTLLEMELGGEVLPLGGEKPRRIVAGYPGMSDILGMLPPRGRFLAVECKRPGGKPTGLQWQFLRTVNRMGGFGFVADSLQSAIVMITSVCQDPDCRLDDAFRIVKG
jgi:hypothetical protein